MEDQKEKKIEESYKDKDFLKVPNTLVDSGLLARMKPSEIKVYLAIAKHADYKTGRSFPSIALLCNLTGMNKNVVCKATKKLEYYGLNKKYRAPKAFKYRSVYRVLRDPKINPVIIPQKVEKESKRFRGKDGKFQVDSKEKENDIVPQNMERGIPQNMELDTFPQKVELDIVPQNMESNEKELELTRDNILRPKKFSDVDIYLTSLLIEKILENDPKSRVQRMTQKTKEDWLNECRRLREIDNRAPEEIEAVICWCQEDDFEKTVVLSMPKLRKRFDSLWLKFKGRRIENNGRYKPQTDVGSQHLWTEEEREKYIPMIDKEYKEKLQAYMKKEGITDEEDVNHFKVPSLTDYRIRKLKEIKREGKNENI